jgi:hypothetical protein
VLESLRVRRELEPVDPERADAQMAATNRTEPPGPSDGKSSTCTIE